MKNIILGTLLALSTFSLHAVEDFCQKKGWQDALIVGIDMGDDSAYWSLKIKSKGKYHTLDAHCKAKSCAPFNTEFRNNQQASLPLNLTAKVKLSSDPNACPNGDSECLENIYPNCSIDEMKILSDNKPKPQFTQAGLEGKPILESCYHDPCSVARVMHYEVLENNKNNRLLKLNLVGGERYWDKKKVKWNHKAHDVYIRCSLTKPTVQNGNQKTLIPLNPNGVYGAVMSATELYLSACHNYKGSDAKAAKKFGYNVKEP